jgi:PAS domain S-box-containing protein
MVEFGPDSGLMAVIIQEHGHAALRPVSDEDGTGPSDQAVIQQLEDDLRTAREDLQAAVEELESSNEELKSSNEELITSNEELQSANEELQTSKEELQSVNEELATVNAELNKKVAELDAAHNDLQNLFASTEIATIFLDRRLRIKKFTPAATALFHLRESDVDRPIVDLAPRFAGTDLLSDVGEVLKSLSLREKEITAHDGDRCFLMRVLPYRTAEDVIAGVVVTFVDITTRKRAEEALAKSREEIRRQLEEIETIYHSAPIGLCVFDLDLRYLRINERLAEINGLPASAHLGKTVREIVPDLADQAERLAAGIVESGQPVMNIEFSGTTLAQPGAMRTWVEHWLPLKDDGGQVIGIQVAAEEVTERKRAEENLRAQTELLTGIVDNIPVLLCIWDPALQSFRFNNHLREVLGWTEADAGPDFMEKVYPDPEYRRQVIDFMQSLKTGWRDLKTTAKDGSAIDISWANISLSDGTSVGIGVDIRPRKSAEEALRRALATAEERGRILDAILENVPEGITLADGPDVTIRMVSRFGQEMLGGPHDLLTAEQVAGRWAVYHPDGITPMRVEDLPLVRAIRRGEVVRDCELVQVNEQGRRLWLMCNAGPIRDGSGNVVAGVVGWQEITERKKAEQALRQREEELRGILDAAQESIWVFSPECVVLNANRKGLERMGKTSQEILGKRIAEVLPPELGRSREKRVREVLESGRAVEFEDERAGIQFHHSFYPVMDRAGRVNSVVSFSRDITEQKALQEELKRSRDQLETRVLERTAELERKNRELQDFAFIASHDLNEPLRKIQTFGSLVEARSADRLDQQQRDYISRITGSANRMQELLAALLNYSRIESKGEEFRPTPLNDVVRDAISDLELGVKKAGAQVIVGPMPTVIGDAAQIRQLFQNLIENAIKFRSREAPPVIKFHCAEEDGLCRVLVEDNGIGFDEKYLDKIFQPFQRLHGKHEYPGTGIGLAICKKILERHGGTITAKSAPGRGSTFIVTLPVTGGRR